MTKETFQFDADVAQLIQLVTHSIYSNTDIFLRELISNANDACQKARMLSLQDSSYLGDETTLEISVDVDTENKTITITDTGIGMSREEVIEHIGTIAKSGTKAFVETLKKQATAKKKKEENNESTDLIGQFGIGFYSAFMVAKKVELITKANGHDAIHWESTGDGNYEITDADKTTRGTTVILHLNDQDDNEAYADHHRMRGLIKQHSNYVPVPITMWKLENGTPSTERETINEMKSLWTKRKSEIKASEYEEFYKALTYNQEGPFDTIHIAIEGTINFKALLFIPKSPSMFESMM
jgi:molecular chaperone HtpG